MVSWGDEHPVWKHELAYLGYVVSQITTKVLSPQMFSHAWKHLEYIVLQQMEHLHDSFSVYFWGIHLFCLDWWNKCGREKKRIPCFWKILLLNGKVVCSADVGFLSQVSYSGASLSGLQVPFDWGEKLCVPLCVYQYGGDDILHQEWFDGEGRYMYLPYTGLKLGLKCDLLLHWWLALVGQFKDN